MDSELLTRAARLVQSMYWTGPTAIFFTAIVLMLAGMTAFQLVWPTVERKGFLPMATTRGDRLFIGLLGSAWIHVLWLAVMTPPLWWASLLAILWFAIVMRFG